MVKRKKRAKKVIIDGFKFDSIFEGSIYTFLKPFLKKGFIIRLGMQITKPMMVLDGYGESHKVGDYKFDFVIETKRKTYYIEAKGFLYPRDIYRVKVAKIVFQSKETEFLMVWQAPNSKTKKKENEYFYNLFK